MKTYVLLLILALLTSTIVTAQTFEIRAVNKGNGFVGVEMRATSNPPPTTGNFVTDIVFGLKWLTSYNVDLSNTVTTSYNIIKSDVRKTKGMYYFQAFSASIATWLKFQACVSVLIFNSAFWVLTGDIPTLTIIFSPFPLVK